MPSSLNGQAVMKKGDKFASRLGCIDGRGKEAAIRYAKSLDYTWVDTVTGPGIVASCAGTCHPIQIENNGRTYDYDHEAVINNAVVALLVSIRKHGSDLLILDAHAECAGNPVPREEQIKQLIESANFWRSLGGDFDSVAIHCLFIEPNAAGDWDYEVVYALSPAATTAQETITLKPETAQLAPVTQEATV